MCQHLLRFAEAFCLTWVQIPPQRVLVIYDDLDLPLGKVRLRAKGSHGGHNGMRSIMQHMKGAQDFPRLKIGIGRPEGRMPVAAFVLQVNPNFEEQMLCCHANHHTCHTELNHAHALRGLGLLMYICVWDRLCRKLTL